MQDVDCLHSFTTLPAASNDNDDLLEIDAPYSNLAIIRSIKYDMQQENAESGLLLRSRKKRKFFQEILDAENYILMRYFSQSCDIHQLNRLKRHILDHYLFPKS